MGWTDVFAHYVYRTGFLMERLVLGLHDRITVSSKPEDAQYMNVEVNYGSDETEDN